MKENKFIPIKIADNHEAQRQYTSDFNDKIKRFEALYLYLSKFIKIEDKNTYILASSPQRSCASGR